MALGAKGFPKSDMLSNNWLSKGIQGPEQLRERLALPPRILLDIVLRLCDGTWSLETSIRLVTASLIREERKRWRAFRILANAF